MKSMKYLLLGIVVYMTNANGMSLEMFHKLAQDKKKTSKELVEAYDKLLHHPHREMAGYMVKKYRAGKTIDDLRAESSAQPAKPAAKPKGEDEWPT